MISVFVGVVYVDPFNQSLKASDIWIFNIVLITRQFKNFIWLFNNWSYFFLRVTSAVLLLGCVFAGFLRYFNVWGKIKISLRSTWRNIVRVVHFNDLPVTVIFCVNSS